MSHGGRLLEQAHRLIGSVALGAAHLLGDEDGKYREHRLQAALANQPPSLLGLDGELRREYPASRPYPRPKGRGFIDFLGYDAEGRIHVVETKIGR
jgi:RecB family endonuclease NucS